METNGCGKQLIIERGVELAYATGDHSNVILNKIEAKLELLEQKILYGRGDCLNSI